MVARARRKRLGPKARWAIRIVLVLLVVWIIASGVVLWQSYRHADDGLDALARARSELEGGGLLRGAPTESLREAEQAFREAHDSADGPVLAPWRVIPGLGSNVSSIESLTQAAERVAGVGARAAEESSAILDQDPATPEERLALLSELERVSARTERELESVDLGTDFLLVEPLGDARDRFSERLNQVRDAAGDARRATEGVQQVLTGPKKYLVLAANNGEMRAGSGMLLSAGVATFENGEFTLGDMRPSPDFNLPAGAVPLPKELEELWGFVPVTQDWRYLATSPRFDVTGPLAADMWKAATGEDVDGVLVVDPVALQALLAAQGPIDTGERQVSADDVVQYLLLGQYEGLDIDDTQASRRDQLSTVARGAVDTLVDRPWNTGELVRQLGDVGKGRHVLAWSRDSKEQRAWEAAGIAGKLRPDSLAVNLLNTGGNKLDQFVAIHVNFDAEQRLDGGHDAQLQITMENTAPTDLPSYVGGPYGGTDLAEGEYQGILTINSPGAGSFPEIEGAGPLIVAGRDGPTNASGVAVRIPRGEQRSVEVRFRLPAGLDSLLVEPSGRVPPISWDAEGERFEDNARHRVDL